MQQTKTSVLKINMPSMWYIPYKNYDEKIPPEIARNISYPIHHLQYNNLDIISPILNTYFHNNTVEYSTLNNLKIYANVHIKSNIDNGLTKKTIPFINPSCMSKLSRFSKKQYKYPTNFKIMADIQYDIYHLYAYNSITNSLIYYDMAYIPNLKISINMNKLFRNIRENQNLDYIEESDDESDFENVNEDKYVDLKKMIIMECSFHTKFKRWVPIRILDDMNPSVKIIHINKLVDMD